jgi:CBS domain-containing protein
MFLRAALQPLLRAARPRFAAFAPISTSPPSKTAEALASHAFTNQHQGLRFPRKIESAGDVLALCSDKGEFDGRRWKEGLEPFAIDSEETVYSATKEMAKYNVGAVMITEAGKVRGIFTERDYLKRVIHKGHRSRETKVCDVATLVPDLIVVTPQTSVEDCVAAMSMKGIRHLPVVDSMPVQDYSGDNQGEHREQLVGMISVRDIIQCLALRLELAEDKVSELTRSFSMAPDVP